ncbi:Putative oxidoreductase [Raoultella ornithinolytica]|nr:Putative oxidoreductase [Raoultella ornithinolytica]
MILINQIVGFVGFQARAIAAFHAGLGFPVRWMPGMPQQEDAPADDFTIGQLTWTPDINDTDLRYANDERQVLLADWLPHPGLSGLAPLLAAHETILKAQHQLLTQLSVNQPFASLVALMTARINVAPAVLTPGPKADPFPRSLLMHYATMSVRQKPGNQAIPPSASSCRRYSF